MKLKSLVTLAQDLLQLYIYTDWLLRHLAGGAAINNQTSTKSAQEGPGPPQSPVDYVINSSIAASVFMPNVTLNRTSSADYHYDSNDTSSYYVNINNNTNYNLSSSHPPRDSILATNFRVATRLEYGSQAYVIILLSAIVLIALVFTIFGLFMKAEAHTKSDLRSALLFDDKNLLSFSGIGVQGVGLDTTL